MFSIFQIIEQLKLLLPSDTSEPLVISKGSKADETIRGTAEWLDMLAMASTPTHRHKGTGKNFRLVGVSRPSLGHEWAMVASKDGKLLERQGFAMLISEDGVAYMCPEDKVDRIFDDIPGDGMIIF